MEKKMWAVFGYWAIALFLTVATLLIGHWTRGTIPWDNLDSGWVQAIGSIAALGVTIYVLKKQTTFAVETENRVLKRQADTVAAIVAKLHDEIQHYAKQLSDSHTAPAALFELKDIETFCEVSKAVDGIPLYSLGSVKMVNGIFEMQRATARFKDLFALGRTLTERQPDIQNWNGEEIARHAQFMGMVSKIAYGIFLDGHRALTAELATHIVPPAN
jgi:hypothetical protein